MELYSLWFICFLGLSLAMYYAAGRFFPKYQWLVLLAASLVFYGWAGLSDLAYILFTSLSVWLGGRYFQKQSELFSEKKKSGALDKAALKDLKNRIQRKKRAVLFTVLITNFGLLAFLKVADQLIVAASRLFSRDFQPLGLVLPLGISFFIFQSAGYLIDVYNSKYAAEKSFLRFLLFVSFFPQLIQGPINRYDQLAAQLSAPHRLTVQRAKDALLLILFGLMKKAAIADLLVDGIAEVFDGVSPDISGSMVIFWILMYSLQQYADFSGGIDMVTGVAQLFGIDMAPNFRQPYFAVSLADFWRRWHISLGAWMRDYVFYPFALTKPMQSLGKAANKRLGKHLGRTLPAVIANLLVFFIVGIWHGTQLHFILWGLYNGVVIGLSDLLSPVFDRLSRKLKIDASSKGFKVFQIVRTFIIVNIGWYFDRIYRFNDCVLCLRRSVTALRLSSLYSELSLLENYQETRFLIMIAASVIVFVNSIIREKGKDSVRVLRGRPLVLRWGVYFVMIFLVLLARTFYTVNGGFMYAAY